MPIRIASLDWPRCTYRVRHAEAREGIFQSPGWRASRHRLWAIDVGPVRGMVRVNGTVYRRNSHSVGIYAPGTEYEENIEVGRLVSWAWLLIEERGKPSQLSRLTGEAGFCLLADPAQGIRKKIVELVETATGPAAGRSFLLAALLNHILGTLFILHSKSPKEGPQREARYEWSHPWRKTAWTLLEHSSQGTLTARQLADELGISASTLTHQYRSACGESFQETLDQWRVEKACALLSRKELSVKEIAARVGLSHQSYLSAFFKAATGYGPSEYRRLISV